MIPDDLPQDMPSFIARFGSHEQCRGYLFEARRPDGFRCAACGHDDAYALRTKIVYECVACREQHSLLAGTMFERTKTVYECVACREQHSLLAGTMFERTKTGLSRSFLAIYLVTSSKGGIAAA